MRAGFVILFDDRLINRSWRNFLAQKEICGSLGAPARRFVDFLEENVTAYSDTEIGGAARVVHEGCRKVVRDHLQIEPVRTEAEGARLTLAAGFDAAAVRLTGNVVGQPPFTGTLMHRGWRVAQITLPKLAEGHDVRVLAPAEVEL